MLFIFLFTCTSMHHCYTRMCLVGPNELCTDMFQGNDASSRWTASQQTRRKADPIVWMCSVQQQVKEWKSFCNNGTFCQRHRSRLCLLFIKLHSSRPRLVSIKLHSSSPRPLSITLFSSRSPLLSIKLYSSRPRPLSIKIYDYWT